MLWPFCEVNSDSTRKCGFAGCQHPHLLISHLLVLALNSPCLLSSEFVIMGHLQSQCDWVTRSGGPTNYTHPTYQYVHCFSVQQIPPDQGSQGFLASQQTSTANQRPLMKLWDATKGKNIKWQWFEINPKSRTASPYNYSHCSRCYDRCYYFLITKVLFH